MISDPIIDFSVIGKVENEISTDSLQQSELAGLEIVSLEQAKTEAVSEENKQGIEKTNIELAQLRAGLESSNQDIDLRGKFSEQILIYLWVFSGFCGLLLLLQGFKVQGFDLNTPILVTLVGGTAASAFGLVSVVLGGLFRNAIGKAAAKVETATKVEKDVEVKS